MATRRRNKRKVRRRGRFGALYKLMSLVLILVVVVAGCIVFFRVEDIVVTGQQQYSAEEIITASGIEQGDYLFTVNKFKAYHSISTKLPYVDEVSIRRAYPDSLVITLTECVPALLVKGPSSWWVADAKGKLLEEVTSGSRAGTAKVSGLTSLLPTAGTLLAVDTPEAPKLETLLDLTGALADRDMMGKVSDIDLTGSARLRFTYDGRFTVVLPLVGDYERAARALQLMVEEQLQPNDAGEIDMTSVGQPKEAFVFSPS